MTDFYIELAEKAQLDAQNQMLNALGGDVSEINSKMEGTGLESVVVAVLDFAHDNVTITHGALNTIDRRIST